MTNPISRGYYNKGLFTLNGGKIVGAKAGKGKASALNLENGASYNIQADSIGFRKIHTDNADKYIRTIHIQDTRTLNGKQSVGDFTVIAKGGQLAVFDFDKDGFQVK